MKTMLEIMIDRLPEGLTVASAKQRSGSSQTAIDFEYDGTKVKGWLQNTCAPGCIEKNCDFTITAAMVSIGLARNDFELVKVWKEKQEAVLGI